MGKVEPTQACPSIADEPGQEETNESMHCVIIDGVPRSYPRVTIVFQALLGG